MIKVLMHAEILLEDIQVFTNALIPPNVMRVAYDDNWRRQAHKEVTNYSALNRTVITHILHPVIHMMIH